MIVASLPNMQLAPIGGVHPWAILAMAGLVVCVTVAIKTACSRGSQGDWLRVGGALLLGLVIGTVVSRWGV